MQHRYHVLYLIVLFGVASCLAMSVGPRGDVTAAIPVEGLNLNAAIPDLYGTWSGTWVDTVYAVGGAMTIVITGSGGAYDATGTIDLSPIGAGVLNGTGTGTGDGTTASGSFSCAGLGNGTFSLNSVFAALGPQMATGGGSGTVVAPLNFGPFTFTGNVYDTQIVGTFDFTNPGGGKGIGALMKVGAPVVEQTWGSIKSKYSEGG